MTSTALFVSWGRGNGHLTRLLHVAHAFREEGWRCVFVSHAQPVHESLLSRAGFGVAIGYPESSERADPWTSWSDDAFLAESIAFDAALLADVRPQVIVNDNRLSMLISSLAADTPIVTLCQDNQMPGYRYPGAPVATIWTDPIVSINRQLVARGLDPISEDARELFARGKIAIPSTPEWDPVEGATSVVYTGRLGAPVPEPLAPTDLLFYRAVGEIDTVFVESFADWPGRVFIATGDPARADSLRGADAPFIVEALCDLEQIGPQLRGAVHHGGHGIVTACLDGGIPSIVLPGRNPERLANGRRAERGGLARVLGSPGGRGPEWGPAVDVTNDRPDWPRVRSELDRLPPRPSGRFGAAPLTSEQLVSVLT